MEEDEGYELSLKELEEPEEGDMELEAEVMCSALQTSALQSS